MMSLDPISAAFDLGATLIDKFVESPKDKADKLIALQKLRQKGELAEMQLMIAQIEVNKVQAASKSFFVAGARPSIMWICGIAMGVQYLIYPFIPDYVVQLKMETMMPVLLGLLGLGGYRSFDKSRNTQTDHI